MAVSSFISYDSTYDDYVKYSDDDRSTDSYLNYYQQEGDALKHVDSYNFVHDTDTFASRDIPQDFDDKYNSYLDKFDDGFSFIHMQKLTASKSTPQYFYTKCLRIFEAAGYI